MQVSNHLNNKHIVTFRDHYNGHICSDGRLLKSQNHIIFLYLRSSDDQETQESRFETQGNDLASRLWSASLSNQSNMKRFRAIRTGLLQNMNITIHELYDAVDSGDMKEVRFQLKQINEKWKDIQDLHRAIIKLLSDDDTVGLQEETKLLVDNRDVLLRLNDQAEEFLAGKKNSTTSTISQVTSEIKSR